QGRDAVRVGLEIVDHPDVPGAELCGEGGGVHHPWKIRRLAPPVADGSGDAERRMSHLQRVRAQELPDDLLEAFVRAAGEGLLDDDVRLLPIPEERDVRLRAADVAGEDHQNGTPNWSASTSASPNSCAAPGLMIRWMSGCR